MKLAIFILSFLFISIISCAETTCSNNPIYSPTKTFEEIYLSFSKLRYNNTDKNTLSKATEDFKLDITNLYNENSHLFLDNLLAKGDFEYTFFFLSCIDSYERDLIEELGFINDGSFVRHFNYRISKQINTIFIKMYSNYTVNYPTAVALVDLLKEAEKKYRGTNVLYVNLSSMQSSVADFYVNTLKTFKLGEPFSTNYFEMLDFHYNRIKDRAITDDIDLLNFWPLVSLVKFLNKTMLKERDINFLEYLSKKEQHFLVVYFYCNYYDSFDYSYCKDYITKFFFEGSDEANNYCVSSIASTQFLNLTGEFVGMEKFVEECRAFYYQAMGIDKASKEEIERIYGSKREFMERTGKLLEEIRRIAFGR